MTDPRTFALLALEAADRVAARHADRGDWRDWLARSFRSYTTAPFGERHVRFWEWIAALEPGVRLRPRVEAWPRGGGKSSTIELGCAWLAAQPEPPRRFVLYVSGTQAQADKHVQAIAAMLERVGISRSVNRYGHSRGWRRQELRTAHGFGVVAFGLDSGMRGARLDEHRPDLIVLDDIDDRLDSEETVAKKVAVLTETVLPAGAPDAAVVAVQNLIHEHSIMAQLASGTADFLHDRLLPTVEPAVEGLQVERVIDDDGARYVITGGTPTWAGQSLETCEHQINTWGLGAFLREAQHDVAVVEGGLWDRARDLDPFRHPHGAPLPEFDRIVVGVDPNIGEGGDAAGIIVAGRAEIGEIEHAWVLDDRTVTGGPKRWAEAAVAAYEDYQADEIVAEKNQGGDMVEVTIGTVSSAPPVTLVHASRGKRTRAEPVAKLYGDGRVHHSGVFVALEHEMCRWVPGQPSPNRMDALVWAVTDLMLTEKEDGPLGIVAVGSVKESMGRSRTAATLGEIYDGPLRRGR